MADLEQVVNDLNLASQSLQELREKYDGALDLLDNKNTEITGALDSAKSDALQEIQTISDTATSQISQLKDTSLNLVNEAKNTATTEISNKKEEHKQELETKKNEYINEIDAKANEYDIANINAQVQAMDTKITEQINGAKTELNSKIDNKVTKTGDETIAGVKTFSVPPVSATNPTANNQVANKSYVDTALNTKANLNGDNIFNGTNTFNQALTSGADPTNDNHLTRKSYVDYGGGIRNLGTTGSINLDLRQAQHFILTMTARGAIGIANWGGAGKSGTITVNNAENITAFSAPFKFRVAQSGFSGTETFAYFCIAPNNVRLVRT
ncbi:hypothetical protein [Campylobacter jejuni]|uniref:hypothetical protein n=1 Tax=Campylobacter jejuni TaxID=197 RepID=UPI00211C7611|nr:hypothetical protein [Campylobacter jejuni]